MKNKLFGLTIAVGFFVILFTAGSSDLNSIDFITILARGGIGLLLCGIGFIGLNVERSVN